jgi:hypothetical protein
MLAETEQRGAADAASALLQVQDTLAAAQLRLLGSQPQLSSQQAAVLATLSAAGALPWQAACQQRLAEALALSAQAGGGACNRLTAHQLDRVAQLQFPAAPGAAHG